MNPLDAGWRAFAVQNTAMALLVRPEGLTPNMHALAKKNCGRSRQNSNLLDARRIDLDELLHPVRAPGFQYVAVDKDGTIFEGCAGVAGIANATPMTLETTLMAYSMSKTFTAAAVLKLAEAGKLGLDDPLDQYFEGSPYGSGVTIRGLLSHTAGIPNPIPLKWVHLASRHGAFDERAALQGVLRRHPKLASPPGKRYLYSNIGYWLLGDVVAKASGQAFEQYVDEQVLAPLAISPRELGFQIADPANHANGYVEKRSIANWLKRFLIDPELVGGYEGPWLRLEPHYVNGPAFGGLVGSARGIAKFLQDQLQPESAILGEVARSWFYEQQAVSDGELVLMTLGWHVGIGRRRYFYKEGGGGGFHCTMRLYPVEGMASVLMTNATFNDVNGSIAKIDDILMETLLG